MTNQDFCAAAGGDVGIDRCDPSLEKPIAILLSQSPIVVPRGKYDEAFEFLLEQTKADDFSSRLLPLTGIGQTDDNSEAATEGTLAGYGVKKKLADGTIAYTFHFLSALCRLKAMNKLVGMSGYAFLVDENKLLIGARDKDGLRGLRVDSITTDNANAVMGDGQNMKSVKVKISFGSDQKMIDTMRVIRTTDFDVDQLSGLQSVVLEKAGALTYRVQTECNDVNLFGVGTFAEKLAQKEVWKVTNLVTGASVQVASVAAMPASGAFEFTPAAPIGAAYKLGVTLEKPSVLEGNGVIGINQSSVFIDNVTAA